MIHRFISARVTFRAVAALLAATGSCRLSAADGAPANASMKPEAQKESDWVDNRWSKTDIGPFLASTLQLPGATVARALSIRVGERRDGAVCYDTATASWRAAWIGGFLRPDPARYGLIHPPRIDGSVLAQAPAPPTGLNGVRYVGLHRNGDRVVIESAVGDVSILETPWLHHQNGLNVFTRHLDVAPSAHPIVLGLLTTSEPAQVREANGSTEVLARFGTNAIALRAASPGTRPQIRQEGPSLLLELPASERRQSVRIALAAVASAAAGAGVDAVLKSIPETDFAALRAPGPARWLPELSTRGQRGLDLDFLTVDTLTVPYQNPWNALMFMAGVDFGPDGAAYVCTIHGDVWRVTGIDDSLRDLRWHRFATGLFQPLGLKVRDGNVFVLGRDRITRLHDENRDGEADYYENFCGLIETSSGGHDYVTCLELDAAGNFYYVDPKGIHRVSPDGRRMETIATGWRNPNGMGVSPDGRVLTVAPQQGDWTPSSQISQVRAGGFYGYGGPRVSDERPLGYDAPLCWIPHGVDNSSGSQVWVPSGRWGALGGQMLHLLWGRCGYMLVLRDEVRGTSQGAVVPLPGKLLSGPNRGTFNHRDGHLYVAGSTGWQTAAAKDGALQRIRFTGKPVTVPIGWHARSNGVALTFAEPLEKAAAEDAGSYGIRQWNYRYTRTYGSKDWSVTDPERQGRDDVAVKAGKLSADGRTVFIETANLGPVMQMEIKYSLSTAAKRSLRGELWLTLNALDD